MCRMQVCVCVCVCVYELLYLERQMSYIHRMNSSFCSSVMGEELEGCKIQSLPGHCFHTYSPPGGKSVSITDDRTSPVAF